MQNHPKKVNQVLAGATGKSFKQEAVREREQLMLYIVNLVTPYEGWGEADQTLAEYRQAREGGYRGRGWTQGQYNKFTNELRARTERYWPGLWRSIKKEDTSVVERAWAIVGKMRTYLRAFWSADSERARTWHIHRAREYYERLRILPELSQIPESQRNIEAELRLDNPPALNPIEKALFELQKRAQKPKLSPRVCPNDDCERRYFLSTQKGQKYCPDCRRADRRLQRKRKSELKSYHKNKKNWPSTANRRKNRG